MSAPGKGEIIKVHPMARALGEQSLGGRAQAARLRLTGHSPRQLRRIAAAKARKAKTTGVKP